MWLLEARLAKFSVPDLLVRKKVRLLQAGEAALSAVNAVGLPCVFFPWICHLPNGRLKGSKEEEDKENDGRLQQDVAARTELA